MFELSKKIYAILNVASVTTECTGKVWPLLAEQDKKNFVTYAFSYDGNASKDNRTRNTLIIHCYGESYDKALKMHDAVEAVLQENKIFINTMEPFYVEDTLEAAVRSTYDVRTTNLN